MILKNGARIRLLLPAIGISAVIWLSACATIRSSKDPEELARTLDEAIVFVPRTYYKKYGTEKVYTLFKNVKHELFKIPSEIKIPLVIYLHGCNGFGSSSSQDILFLGANGYAVLAPNSFARKYKPKSCDPSKFRGGLHRNALYFRLAEASYAHETVKTLPWVDKKRIFMMGFSEGGFTTAKYGRGGLAGRIILGATCNSGRPELRGISGPKDEPILAVVGSRDLWFTHTNARGDCGRWMASRPNSESIVLDTSAHFVQGFPRMKEKILQFLESNKRN